MAFALAVFGFVVVPIGFKADFAQHRGLQGLVAAAPHRAFQLAGRHPLLHHQSRIKGGGKLQTGLQAGPISGLADAHRRAEVGWFHEAGVAELALQLVEQGVVVLGRCAR